MDLPDDREPPTSLILLEQVRTGDDPAARTLFDRYFARLTALARGQLSRRLAGRVDPEDVVMSAYRSFFVAARDGRFALERGGDLWRLLAAITRHKLLHRVRFEGESRRDPAREVGLDSGDVAPTEPTVEEAVALADAVEQWLGSLDPLARRVVELRLQGHSHAEISADVKRSERTVRRVLLQVRDAGSGWFDR